MHEFTIENNILKQYHGNDRQVIVPDGVTAIAECAFRNQENLHEVIIPDSVTEIGDMAFSSCRSLENVTIPDSVTSLGKDIFWMQN
jgi:hypothetical protein